MNGFHRGTGSAVCGSAVSLTTGFDLHSFLGTAGEVVGLISGVMSIAWVVYQFVQSRRGGKSPDKPL